MPGTDAREMSSRLMGFPPGCTFFCFMAMALPDRIAHVRETVAEACAKAGRDPDVVRLVAVTKGHPAATLREALEAGLCDLGENRIQEARTKLGEAREALENHPARIHLIGHLQRNKARDAVALFDWIQSVDSARLAATLSERAVAAADSGSVAGPVSVLVQVNAAREEAKHGFDPDGAVERALEIRDLPGLEVRGLMTMAPWTEDETVLRRTFEIARGLFERLRDHGGGRIDTLSMGMSNDYALAVEEGSTTIRLGTALFGSRN